MSIRFISLAFKPGDASGQLLLAIQRSEIDYSEFILRGLFPCITAPRTELTQLTTWASATRTREQEVARIESARQRLKQTPTEHTLSLWLQLHLWPYVLLLALSLGATSQGIKTMRQAHAVARSPKRRGASGGRLPPHTGQPRPWRS